MGNLGEGREDTGSLRVAFVQPALPRYRLPVFSSLSERPNIELRLLYEQVPGLDNVDPGALNAEPVRVHRIQTRLGSLLWSPAQWRMASNKKTDVLVLTWNTRYLTLLPALLKARLIGLPTLLWGHGYSVSEGRVRAWLRSTFARLATAVVFYDHTNAETYIDRGGSKDSTFIAQNAIDQRPIARAREAWLADPAGQLAFREKHGLGSGPVVAFVGRLQPHKRPDLLLRAVAMIRDDSPGIQLVLIGGGDDERGRLEAETARLGITEHVRFLGPMYDEDELAPWLLEADVMAFPGALGLSVLTAFGFGLPIIANDDAGASFPEWRAIKPRVNGLLFESGSAESLAASLRELFGKPGFRDSLAAGALATATDEFTMERMVDGLEAAIRYCAATRSKDR